MKSHADALVLFGATGDLARKKLIPVIDELTRAGGWGCSSRCDSLRLGRPTTSHPRQGCAQ
jgi:glucose-6-phosphate 1-dehydrogenase